MQVVQLQYASLALIASVNIEIKDRIYNDTECPEEKIKVPGNFKATTIYKSTQEPTVTIDY